MRYNDWASREPLVSACVAIEDKTHAASANDYIGVVCMDVNVVATLPDLMADLSGRDGFLTLFDLRFSNPLFRWGGF